MTRGPILTKWEGSGAVKWLRMIYLLRWDKPFDGMDNQDALISFDRQIWRILLARLYLKPNNCKAYDEEISYLVCVIFSVFIFLASKFLSDTHEIYVDCQSNS